MVERDSSVIEYISVSDRDTRAIEDATADIGQEPDLKFVAESQFLDELAQRAELMRERFVELQDTFGRFVTGSCAPVIVFKFPKDTVATVSPTPLDFKKPQEENIYSADRLRGFLLGLGDMYGYGYTTQQNGLLHNDIMPIKRMEGIESISSNALQILELHTEDASFRRNSAHDISPDVLSMHFFRNDERVPTVLAKPEWEQLTDETLETLQKALFRNKTSYLQGGSKSDTEIPTPILYDNQLGPEIVFNSATVETDGSAQADKAVAELKSHLAAVSMKAIFKAGEIVFVDNRRVAHGRASQNSTPRYDGTDRWQRRLVAAYDATRLAPYNLTPRVVDPHIFFQSPV